MIIAVDFDGTLEQNGRPNTTLIGILKQHQARGDIVILWTCREGKRQKAAVEFLKRNGFTPNLVNRNAPGAIRMMGHDSRKIYADLYIDDKNMVR